MRLASILVRVFIALVALAVLFLAPVFVTSSATGTSIDPLYAVIDLAALVLLVAALWSIWRSLRAA